MYFGGNNDLLNKMKYMFLVIALISVSILGVLIFGMNNYDPVLIKVFGGICFVGIFGNSICVLRGLSNQ